MMENIEDTLSEGYWTWKKNLILFLPHLLGAAASFIQIAALSVIAIIFFVVLIGMGASSVYSGGSFDWGSVTLPAVLVGVMVLAIFSLVYILVGSFFKAGAAGMSLAALETGRTGWKDMMEYGGKKLLQVYLAELLICILNLLGLLFLAPGAIALFFGPLNLAASLIILGGLLLIVYSTILYVVFYPVTYAIVIDDTGGVEGLKKSYGFVMKNKTSFLMLLFASMFVETVTGLVVNAFTSFLGVIPLLGALVALGIMLIYYLFQKTVTVPLLYVWWARFYMDRTGKKPVTSREKGIRSSWKDAPVRKKARPSISSDTYV